MPAAKTVCIGVLSHRHGVDCYVGRDRITLYEKIAAFCRQWWDELPRKGPAPEDNEQCVTAYFDEHPSEYVSWFMDEEID
jgi:hypothetical protein